ncbi:hypothetical protein Y032_0004g1984 [Ancylostoma ceylanicum]|uniref:C-type lectin domain-containing protein n=1 Tax=Ancylostoma ceylanicum TaxID=53326 RepID=A0A016VU89_9BILA|nr:hypothetical protein Y032_0004g1984 [Ancylostoma ceylanicum]
MEGKENYSNFIWIGLKKDEKEVWHWVDGTEMNFKKWSTGEPNNLENKEGCGQVDLRTCGGGFGGARSYCWNMRYKRCRLELGVME